MKNVFTYALLLVFLTSCNSLNFINIDVKKPAQVTIPATVRSVAIVNNSAVQPSNIGHENVEGKEENNIEVHTDSLGIILTQATAQFIGEENFYDNVVAYNTPLRADNLYLTEAYIDSATIDRIIAETGADAIVSIDRLLVSSRHLTVVINGKKEPKSLCLGIDARIRIYMPPTYQAYGPVSYKDSVCWAGTWRDSYYSEDIPEREEALKHIVLRAADRISLALVPSWETEERWYYSDANTEMKKASVKASANDWLEAAKIWGELFDKDKNTTKKAKLAMNIALANEMLDDMENASVWVDIAIENFKLAGRKDEDRDLKLSELYKKTLNERISDSKKLDIQTGTGNIEY